MHWTTSGRLGPDQPDDCCDFRATVRLGRGCGGLIAKRRRATARFNAGRSSVDAARQPTTSSEQSRAALTIGKKCEAKNHLQSLEIGSSPSCRISSLGCRLPSGLQAHYSVQHMIARICPLSGSNHDRFSDGMADPGYAISAGLISRTIPAAQTLRARQTEPALLARPLRRRRAAVSPWLRRRSSRPTLPSIGPRPD